MLQKSLKWRARNVRSTEFALELEEALGTCSGYNTCTIESTGLLYPGKKGGISWLWSYVKCSVDILVWTRARASRKHSCPREAQVLRKAPKSFYHTGFQ